MNKIKKIKSWSKPDKEGLIGRKKVDWSIFKYGTQIPIIFHEDFEEANNLEKIEVGDKKDITLHIDGQSFHVRIININAQNSDKGMLQLRYDSNNELKELLKERFKSSYNYLKDKYDESEGGYHKTPEEIEEFIEFYKTEEPFVYRLELVTASNKQEQPMRNSLFTIMKEYQHSRTTEEFASHRLGDIMRADLPAIIEDYMSTFPECKEISYTVKGSVGQGTWARVPWLAIMDEELTTTTREEFYVVYLFSEDMEHLYLALHLGVTDNSPEKNKRIKEWMRNDLDLSPMQTEDGLNLSASTDLGQKYEKAAVAYTEYDKDSFPDEEKLVSDLEQALTIYKRCKEAYLNQEDDNDNNDNNDSLLNPSPEEYPDIMDNIIEYISSQGFVYPQGMLANFYLSLKTKPFVILAGISGTGKTRLIQQFAQAVGATSENGAFRLVSVRPDWSDGSDLLGYTSIQGIFQPGQLLSFAHKAAQDPERIYIFGLDEMNLARVEYYLSDILSVLETREKTEEGIMTEFILDEEELSADDEALDKYSCLSFPDNLFIVGTVNMDETTHAFSKKVLDRANTIEFSEIDLMNFKLNSDEDREFQGSILHADFLRSDYVRLSDCPVSKEEFLLEVIEKLAELNSVLKQAGMHVGYRVRDEICMYMLYNHRFGLMDFDTAFDFQLMQKILPRLQGSTQRLRDVLSDIFTIATGYDLDMELGPVGDEALSIVRSEPSLYPRSASKVADMLKRFEIEGFTTYWI